MFELFGVLAGQSSRKRIYLDYASVTPVDKRVIKEVLKNLKAMPANPASLYKEGVAARKKLNDARSRVAGCLETHADEIYFTSGGTESNNIAIQGALAASVRAFSPSLKKDKKPHIVSTSIEHPSIKELLNRLEKEKKCTVTYVPVDDGGVVDPKEVKKALRSETVLVSVMYVNNEIGTIQPIHEIAKVIRAFKKDKSPMTGKGSKKASKHGDYPYFHTDACQAAAYETLRIPYLGVDLLTLDGSKIYGPRGTGALYVRRGVRLASLMYGGSQEKSLRPGTENVAHAAGFALALELCQNGQQKESARLRELRDELLGRIKTVVPAISVNGDMQKRSPNNINICLKGMDAEFAVLKLDVRGVCVSSVTSCRAQNEDSSSYVIEALGKGSGQANAADCAKSSLRITLGRYTTKRDIKRAAEAIIEVLTAMI